MKDIHKKILQSLLDSVTSGASHDVISTILGHEENDSKSKDLKNDEDTSEENEVVPGLTAEESPGHSESQDEPNDEDEITKRILQAYLAGKK